MAALGLKQSFGGCSTSCGALNAAVQRASQPGSLQATKPWAKALERARRMENLLFTAVQALGAKLEDRCPGSI